MNTSFVIQKVRKYYYRFLSEQWAIPKGLIRNQPVIINGRGEISVSGISYLGYHPSPGFFDGVSYLEARHEDASIQIGDNCYINNCFKAIAEHGTIQIGNNCLIGCNVEMLNSDFHGISIEHRNDGTHKAKDIIIGNNVWLGNNVTILKGVTIGDNSVVSNGLVISKSIPSNIVVTAGCILTSKDIYE